MSEALLHNMSARPRTPVTYLVPVLRRPWVSFSWTGRRPTLEARQLATLDDHWSGTGLRGAVIVHPMSAFLAERVRPHACTDRDLTLNVLLRTRGDLLLAAMPLLDDPAVLAGRGVATDDPRLIALAGAHR